ncbi:hypothetical protein [Leptolyngbya sp. NIES-2104]|uniref:hypothetical protein n=1 Tax=Leptolyngbya sp. NIES-2104 TaxID=1552121 RepID=UPI0006ECBEDA|nr:hypothetical protein [Leptolyngbya sp. NIES-2104]GAP97571.1 signal transduction histidine kinase [Leptolyngbya sp. NIES-2104]
MVREVLTQRRQVIGMFLTREEAGQSLDRLVLAGFPIAQTFLIGRDSNQSTVLTEFSASDFGAITGTATGLKKGFVLGNLIGGTSGLLLGASLLALPGVGAVLMSSAIAFTLLSGGIGTAAGGIIGAMIGLGLTTEQAKQYSQYVAKGYILLMIEGTTHEIDRAQQLLKKSIV